MKLQEMETTLVQQLHTDRTEIMGRLDLQRKVGNGGREGGRGEGDRVLHLSLPLFRSMKTSWWIWRLPWPKVIVRWVMHSESCGPTMYYTHM